MAFHRFKIKDPQGPLVGSFDTTEEVWGFLQQIDQSLEYYYVEDVVDDIQVHSDDFIEAFKSGEHPEDLQFF